MKCPKCGAELSEDTKFCSYCGEKIEPQPEQNIDNKSFDKGTKTAKAVKTPKPNTTSDKKSIADSIKEKGIAYWNSLTIFGKVVTVAIAVFAILCLVGFASGKKFAGVLSLVQIALIVVAILMHKDVIKAPYTWAKYAVIAVAVLFTLLNVSSYSWSAKKPSASPSASSKPAQTTPVAPPNSNSSSTEESTVTETNYVIEKGSQYAYMADEWNVYIATALSESLVKVECWNKTLSSDRKVSLDHELGTFKINDSANGFSWIDEEHTAFYMTVTDKESSKLKKGKEVLFTININSSDTNKGSDYDENILCFSYKNDDWHLYRAISLTENLVKIEVWYRGSSADKFLYGYDMCVIKPNETDTDFEWTDDEHTSFTITTKDPNNSSWKKDAFVAFTAENENAEYKDVFSFLGSKIAGEGEVKVPSSASSFKYENYQDVEKTLSAAGFTNITTEIKYDIILGWTDEGEVDSVAIDGKTDYAEDTIFNQDAPVIITYHMKEDDDPAKKESTNEEPSESQQSSVATEPVQEENLTVDNCPELATMLSNKAEIDESYSSFVTKYNGRIIEFDGRIDYCTKHGDYNTRFDYLVSAGDYDPDHQVGPSFKFENVNYFDLHTSLDTVSVGLNVHIVAKVKSFDSNSGLFYLEPVSLTGR